MEAGKTCSEIINRDLIAKSPARFQSADRLGAFRHNSFRDLKLNLACLHSRFFSRFFEALNELGVGELAATHVDANKKIFAEIRSHVSADIQNRAATTLAHTLANKYGELAYGNYAAERARQEAAAAGAPQLAAADYADIQQLMNVGKTAEDYQKTALQADIDRFNFEQNKPYQKLSAYLGAAYGAPMGQVSQTTQSGGGKIVCTAMNEAYGFGSFKIGRAHV